MNEFSKGANENVLPTEYGKAYVARSKIPELNLFPAPEPLDDSFDVDFDDDEDILENGNSGLICKETSAERFKERISQVYQQENVLANIMTSKSILPICDYESAIVEAVRDHRVTIVKGSTGCGKSTMVSQFILKDAISRNEPCRVIVTQPRRIAAKALANYVSKACNWPLGDVVGYQVGLDRKNQSENTLILYATPGVVLRKLSQFREGSFISTVTHIIVDEVHERSRDVDFLLLILRSYLKIRAELKMVLMSATIDTGLYEKYFTDPRLSLNISNVPVIRVDVESYQVGRFWLDDLNLPEVERVNHHLELPKLEKDLLNVCQKIIQALDMGHDASISKGAVLVFLPGLDAIWDMNEVLEECEEYRNWEVVILHSRLPDAKESLAFQAVPPNKRKIILATNIAESSVTFPDVQFVLDCCLTKRDMCDRVNFLPMLGLDWASKSEIRQRSGRTGRVADGYVYHLTFRHLYESLPEHPPPEIERTPLPNVVALAKGLPFEGGIKDIFSLALTPPDERDIDLGVLILKEAGALSLVRHTDVDHSATQLTLLGRVINLFPLDINLTKLIMMGWCLGVTEEMITLAAILNHQDLFLHVIGKQHEVLYCKLFWSEDSGSDAISQYRAYKAVMKLGKGLRRNFMKRFHINENIVRDISLLEGELRAISSKAGLLLPDVSRPIIPPEELNGWMKVAMAAAFYPNYLSPIPVCEDIAARILKLHDPRSSIHLKYPIESLTEVSEFLSTVTCGVNLEFFQTDCIADFVCLPMSKEPDAESLENDLRRKIYRSGENVHPPVLLSFRMQRKTPSQRLRKTTRRNFGIDPEIWNKCVPAFEWPKISKGRIRVIITEVHTLTKFSASFADMDSQKLITAIEERLDAAAKTMVIMNPENVRCGVNVIALKMNKRQGGFIRARAEVIHVSAEDSLALLRFVDYGGWSDVPIKKLWQYEPSFLGDLGNVPAQAFLCELKGLARSDFFFTGTKMEAVRRFEELVRGKDDFSTHIEFYSLHYGTAKVSLSLVHDGDHEEEDIGATLLDAGVLKHVEEDRISEDNHYVWISQFVPGIDAVLPKDDSGKFRGLALEHLMSKKQSTHHTTHTGITGSAGINATSPNKLYFRSMCEGLKSGRNVRINPDSINFAVIEPSSNAPLCQLLIAQKVRMDEYGSVVVSNTTTMSFMPGLPSLLCMCFSPVVRFSLDRHGKKIVGLFAGVGSVKRESGEFVPVFPDHEMEVLNTIEISEDDIDAANEIRKIMNDLLTGVPGAARIARTDQRNAGLQTKLRRKLKELLMRPRKALGVVEINPENEDDFRNDESFVWNETDVFHPLRHVKFESSQKERVPGVFTTRVSECANSGQESSCPLLLNRSKELFEMNAVVPQKDAEFYFESLYMHRKSMWRKFSSSPRNLSMSPIILEDGSRVFEIKSKTILQEERCRNESDERYWKLESIFAYGLADSDLPEERSGKKQKSRLQMSSIKCSASIDEAVIFLLLDAVRLRKAYGENDEKIVLRIHPNLAPVQLSIASAAESTTSKEVENFVNYLEDDLRDLGFSLLRSESGLHDASICSWCDEMGIPLLLTVTCDTVSNGTILVRSRETTLNEEVHVTKLVEYLRIYFGILTDEVLRKKA
ncbi:unnamed protein product [Notodromas monacha]|uniref:Probable ATP-dependent RNA helicase spindle-E n=1 Tax=Notodromas monacha TaxID=399045 RepID=A0A7R9BEC2_9CRUS|nr:unnamed protein product [Notodromas monacha]CAG0913107.1 unnamed protein product [Notodromas monacha]